MRDGRLTTPLQLPVLWPIALRLTVLVLALGVSPLRTGGSLVTSTGSRSTVGEGVANGQLLGSRALNPNPDSTGFRPWNGDTDATHHDDGLQRRRLAASASTASYGLRVVVVNDIAGHFEVLAGVLASLHRILRVSRNQHSQEQDHDRIAQLRTQLQGIQLAPKPRVVFTGNPSGPSLNGLHDWLGPEVSGPTAWHPFEQQAAVGTDGGGGDAQLTASWQAPADVVICVSAEMAPKVCSAVLAATQPRLAVVVVHRADTHTPTAKFLSLHPVAPLRLVALAPHVANLSSHKLRRPVDWAMPVAPFVPRGPACTNKACLQGFSIQGALRRYKSKHGNGFTRDYAALWSRMLALRAAGQPVPRVIVVGKGERRHLALPPELESSVAFHPWLRYPDFWALISRSFALVPAFGMPVYYESRISSTILASLVTCVPVIAEQRLLDTYTFLSERHVFLRQPGEDEVAAMARVMQMPEADIFARRAALCDLQKEMNARADGLLAQYLRQATSGPAAAAS